MRICKRASPALPDAAGQPPNPSSLPLTEPKPLPVKRIPLSGEAGQPLSTVCFSWGGGFSTGRPGQNGEPPPLPPTQNNPVTGMNHTNQEKCTQCYSLCSLLMRAVGQHATLPLQKYVSRFRRSSSGATPEPRDERAWLAWGCSSGGTLFMATGQVLQLDQRLA